jgi:hypothetical protein
MKTLGYDQPLYILPFDHRGSRGVTASSSKFLNALVLHEATKSLTNRQI